MYGIYLYFVNKDLTVGCYWDFKHLFLQQTCIDRSSNYPSTPKEPSPIAQSVALRRSLVRTPARPIFFPRIDDTHCDRIHSSLNAVRCFHSGYVEKQPVAWKEYCAKLWLKRTTGKHG